MAKIQWSGHTKARLEINEETLTELCEFEIFIYAGSQPRYLPYICRHHIIEKYGGTTTENAFQILYCLYHYFTNMTPLSQH